MSDRLGDLSRRLRERGGSGLTRDTWPRFVTAALLVVVVPPLLGRYGVGILELTQFRANLLAAAVGFAIAGVALNVVMGYAGQISLGHWALAGLGAFISAKLTDPDGLRLAFVWGLLGAMAVTALAGFVVGLPGLRLRGLYLAVATIGFAFAMERTLFQSSLLSEGSGGVALPRPWIGDFELLRNADYLALALLVLVGVWLVDTNITRSKVGRAFQAVRADEDVAASFGVDPGRYKLLAFTISGAFAGAAGAVYGHLFFFATADTFKFDRSLLLVIIVVVGGLGSRAGVVASGAFYGIFPLVLDEIWGNDAIGWDLIVGAALLMYTISRHPGGLAEAMREARAEREHKKAERAVVGDGAAQRLSGNGHGNGKGRGEAPVETVPEGGLVDAGDVAADGGSTAVPRLPDLPRPSGLPPRREVPAGTPLLAARGITVRFGGLRAVDDASLEVHRNRIVGLIGPNGAGKTTLFNVVSGVLRPDAGHVHLMGDDVTDRPAHARAAMGLGRTFQMIGLAKDLSVTENLLLAQHQVARYGTWSALVGLGPAPRVEDELRSRAAEAVASLGFERYADTPVKHLSHGQQRIVEIGCALVTAPELVLLDEPSAGMAPGAVENLGARLRDIRDELGRTVLLIEHNIPLVLDVCDELYVLSSGRVIAHGEPDEVVQRAEVRTSYLGEAVL